MLQIQFCLYLHHVGFSQKANYFSALCKCKYWFLMRPVHLWNNFLLNCKKQTRKIRIYRFGIREPMSRTCCWHLPQNKRFFFIFYLKLSMRFDFFFFFFLIQGLGTNYYPSDGWTFNRNFNWCWWFRRGEFQTRKSL